MKAYFLPAVCISLAMLFYSCGDNSTYEAKKDFEHKYWLKSEPVEFEFEINDASLTYDLDYFVRNSIQYPYQNIYLQYYLQDSTGNILSKKLNNIELFDTKTGKPLGSGVGEIFDLEKTFLQGFQFPRAGTYTLRIDQYMREDTLKHIHSIGFILNEEKRKNS